MFLNRSNTFTQVCWKNRLAVELQCGFVYLVIGTGTAIFQLVFHFVGMQGFMVGLYVLTIICVKVILAEVPRLTRRKTSDRNYIVCDLFSHKVWMRVEVT